MSNNIFTESNGLDHDLLFGALAVQDDLLAPRQFVEACRNWSARKDRPLLQYLLESARLSVEAEEELARRLQRKLDRHGGNPRAALSAMSSQTLEQTFAAVPDPAMRFVLLGPGKNGHGIANGTAAIPTADGDEFDDYADEAGDPQTDPLLQRIRKQGSWTPLIATLVSVAVIVIAFCVLLFPAVQQWAGGGRAPDELPEARFDNPIFGNNPGGQEARSVVQALFDVLVKEEAVVDRLNHDPNIDEQTRKAALTLVSKFARDPERLNNTSWYVVRQPGLSKPDYQRALLFAEEAYRLKPDGVILNTLGVAQFRVGEYALALKTLKQSRFMNEETFRRTLAADLAFIAMAQFHLGEKGAAEATLQELRNAVMDGGWEIIGISRGENEAMLKEADALIKPKQQPTNPKQRPVKK